MAASTLFFFFLLIFCQNASYLGSGVSYGPQAGPWQCSHPASGVAGGERLEMQNIPCFQMLLTHQSNQQ